MLDPIYGEAIESGRRKAKRWCEAQLRDEGITNAYQTITSIFKLDPQQPQQQKVANNLIRNFDRRRLFRMLLELLVESNLPFHLLDNPRFRGLLEYLNPIGGVTEGYSLKHKNPAFDPS